MSDTNTTNVRADARRNRERLVEVARRAFNAGGGKVTLARIAREAGVGIGTLYRHFPTREALVEAVYRAELDRLCASAAELAPAHPADVALRAWMDRFAGYLATKRELGTALQTVAASGAIATSQVRHKLGAAVQILLAAGAADGTLRTDLVAEDLVAGIVGIFLVSDGPEQAARLLDLLLAGLRPH